MRRRGVAAEPGPSRYGSTAARLEEAGSVLARNRALAGLAGDALAWVLATSVAPTGRWLVVVDEQDRADRLIRGLRFFHADPDRVLPFPEDDGKPYDGFSPDVARVRQRIVTLERVGRGGDVVVVATARGLLLRVPDAEARAKGTRTIEQGQRLDRDELVRFLSDAGYLHTTRADEPGRFVARGDLVDVWPVGNRAPLRVDFFDDEVERLIRLDPDTGRPQKVGRKVTILPAAEERVDAAACDRALVELGKSLTSSRDLQGAARRRAFVEELRSGVRFSALQDWLPVLVGTVAPLEALAGLERLVVSPVDVEAALRDAESDTRRRFEALEPDERPLVSPAERYLTATAVAGELASASEVHELGSDRAVDFGARGTEDLAVRGAELGPVVARLLELAADDGRVGLVVEDEGRRDRLEEMLAPHGLHPKRVTSPRTLEAGEISVLVGDLPRGFVAPASGLAFVPVTALFGAPRRQATMDRAHELWEASVTATSQLKVDDPIVHRLHGVGVYKGLVRLAMQGSEQDFVRLEYRDGDLLFLPVASLEQLSRYTPASAGAHPTLDKLGGLTFARKKGKVRDTLLSMAQELLRLYARRELAHRPGLPPPGPRYRAFEARFPYRETPDQATAIDAVMDDLSREHPMDRLICGDVGFGKTEVAMRAAMRVIEAGRQVLVLCPTTVLAHQHWRTFLDRFGVDPRIKVGMLSRFTPPQEEERVLAGLADGSVQIAVGTTSLLGRSVRFAHLGLAVIDEEHRFGVRQKDRLKRMRTEVDMLSLSATPIPRSLQLALSGAREMTLIATPPPDRLSVRTQLARFSEARVRDAITAEIERGGQVYFVHNRVETLGRMADELRGWMPHLRFVVGHGQMDPADLEKVIVDFVERRCDVLVCSTIVESGVDLPNVNTMIVNRADQLGLAQLYQLRGRVGRGDRRATCLLLTPEEVTPEARKRLRVLLDHQSLGAGFKVAAADLELRGGGNLLGTAQSGQIDEIGYETWVELLEEAVHAARGDLEAERIDPEVEVPVRAFLPDNLVTDTDERLGWYRRISECRSAAEVDRALEEFESEFKEMPEPARNLGDLVITRLACRDLGIVRCSWHKVRVTLVLHPKGLLAKPGRLDEVLARHPKRFERRSELELAVRFTPQEGERPLRYLRWVFSQLHRVEAPPVRGRSG